MSKLSDLLNRAKLAEDRSAASFAECNRHYQSTQRQIEQLITYHQEFTVPNAIAPVMLDAILFGQRLGASIDEMKQRLIPLSADLDQHKLLWQTARTRRLALEKLVAKEHEKNAVKIRKQERQKSDTLVALSNYTQRSSEQ